MTNEDLESRLEKGTGFSVVARLSWGIVIGSATYNLTHSLAMSVGAALFPSIYLAVKKTMEERKRRRFGEYHLNRLIEYAEAYAKTSDGGFMR